MARLTDDDHPLLQINENDDDDDVSTSLIEEKNTPLMKIIVYYVVDSSWWLLFVDFEMQGLPITAKDYGRQHSSAPEEPSSSDAHQLMMMSKLQRIEKLSTTSYFEER